VCARNIHVFALYSMLNVANAHHVEPLLLDAVVMELWIKISCRCCREYETAMTSFLFLRFVVIINDGYMRFSSKAKYDGKVRWKKCRECYQRLVKTQA